MEQLDSQENEIFIKEINIEQQLQEILQREQELLFEKEKILRYKKWMDDDYQQKLEKEASMSGTTVAELRNKEQKKIIQQEIKELKEQRTIKWKQQEILDKLTIREIEQIREKRRNILIQETRQIQEQIEQKYFEISTIYR